MEKIAKMAKIEVSDSEKLKSDIESVIKMAEVLKDIEFEKALPDEEGFLREDEIKPSFERSEMLDNAPMKKDGHIIVPKTVGE